MTRPEFTRRGFTGAVVGTEWLPGPNGGLMAAVAGVIDVLEDKELLGFAVNDRDSKWGVRVASPDGKTVVVLPGCKVKAVMVLPDLASITSNDWWVLR